VAGLAGCATTYACTWSFKVVCEPPTSRRHRHSCTRAMHADPPLDLRRSCHIQCTPVPPLAESARSDASISCTFDFFESACCASAVNASRPSVGSCGSAVCSALCEGHTSSRSGSSTRSAAFTLAEDTSRERRVGSVALFTKGGRDDRCCESGEVTVAKSADLSSKPILRGGGTGLWNDS